MSGEFRTVFNFVHKLLNWAFVEWEIPRSGLKLSRLNNRPARHTYEPAASPCTKQCTILEWAQHTLGLEKTNLGHFYSHRLLKTKHQLHWVVIFIVFFQNNTHIVELIMPLSVQWGRDRRHRYRTGICTEHSIRKFSLQLVSLKFYVIELFVWWNPPRKPA